MTRAPELPSSLQFTKPTLTTLKSRAVHQLAEDANTAVAVIDLVKRLKGVKPADTYPPYRGPDETAWLHILKRAKVAKFRWHDLRHHFASRLVQRGVPPNTVRDLLGHSSIAMSLRYAHFAPNQRQEAVAKLNERPVLALTMRLQWDGFSGVSGCRVDSIVQREELEPSPPAL